MPRIKNWRVYRKLLVAVVGGALLAAQQYYADGSLSGNDWLQVGSAAVGAFLVWHTSEGPVGAFWTRAKAVAYGLTAVLANLYVVLPGGLAGQEKLALLITFLTGAGVLAAKNDPEPVE